MNRSRNHIGAWAQWTWLAAFTLLVLASRLAQAEDRNDAALWTANQIAIPLDERLTAHLMVQNRWKRNLDSYERTVVRPWLSFDRNERITFALGYDAHEF